MITKINPFAQIYEAFRGFVFSDAFHNLRKQSTGSKIAYSVIISLLTGLLICALYAFTFVSDKELTQHMNDLPEFYYLDGEFYCEENFEATGTDSYILIDTSQTQFTQEQAKTALTHSNKSEILLISKTNIIIYKSLTGEYQDMKLSDFMGILGIQNLSKQQVLSEYKGFIFKVAMFCSLFVVPYQFAKLFFISLILALIALIINAACNTKENFSTLYWISFYMQSAFMIILSICKPFLTLNGNIYTVVCLILFIFTMYRTLKHGEPAAKPVSYTNLNNDFDNFMRQDTYTAPPATSAFDNTYTTPTTAPFDSINSNAPYSNTNTYTESSHNATDSSNSTEQPQRSSGLSLKKND